MKKIIFLSIAVIFLVKIGVFGNSSKVDQNLIASYENQVVLYSTSWCGYCKKARELLKKNGIEYIEHDIETTEQGKDEYDQLNGNGIPLLLVNGEIIRGYDPKRIVELAKKI